MQFFDVQKIIEYLLCDSDVGKAEQFFRRDFCITLSK